MTDGAKLTTEKLRIAVADYCTKNMTDVISQFFQPGPDEEMAICKAASKANNWKRIEKRRDDNELDNYDLNATAYPANSTCWVRVFDCRPLNDQLRAYVMTDPFDVKIVSIDVVGE